MNTNDLTFEERRRLRYERRALRRADEASFQLRLCLVCMLVGSILANLALDRVDAAIAGLLW